MKLYYVESLAKDFASEGNMKFFISAENSMLYANILEEAMMFKTKEEAERCIDSSEPYNEEVVQEFEVFGLYLQKYKNNIYEKRM